MDFGLNHLDYMIGLEAMDVDERRACVLILNELKVAYSNVLQGREECGVAAILCFPKRDPTSFGLCLHKRLPQALIILGYYCVLLDVLDGRWWIHGWASKVMNEIVESLDQKWQHWIEWPMQSVLAKDYGEGPCKERATWSSDVVTSFSGS